MGSKKLILEELQAPIKSFRLYALEQAIEAPYDPEIAAALQESAKTETDPECLLLLHYALQKHAPPQPGQLVAGPTENTGELSETFFTLKNEEKLRRLRDLHGEALTRLASWAVEAFQREEDPLVGAALVRTFRTVWPQEQMSVLGKALFRGFLTVRTAALETLIARVPEALAKDLPRLLTADDPRIRLLALRGLVKVDPEEMQRHLEAILLGGSPELKRAMIQDCSMLPFSLVKKGLLNYLKVETDPGFIEKAGIVFQMNPDVETPMGLLEIVETAGEQKSQLVKAILQGALTTLKESGILGDRFEDYQRNIHEIIQQRLAAKYVREMLQLIESGDEALIQEAEAGLRRNLERPVILDALKKARNWPLSESLLEAIDLLLPGKPLTGKQNPNPIDFVEDLPVEAKIRWFATLRDQDLPHALPVFETVIRKGTVPLTVRAAVFRAATRLRVPGFEALAREWVKETHEQMSTAALEYLAALCPDEVIPLLGPFFASPRPRMKTTAMKVLNQRDPAQALSTLVALLDEMVKKGDSVPFHCLVFFDFFLIRERLTEILMGSANEELVKTGLCLFQANPDRENLYLLYKIEQCQPVVKAQMVARARQEVEKLLIEIGQGPASELATLTGGFAKLWQAEKAKREGPRPAYALKSLEVSMPRRTSKKLPRLAFAAFILLGLGLGLGYVSLTSRFDSEPARPVETPLIKPVIPVPSAKATSIPEKFVKKPDPSPIATEKPPVVSPTPVPQIDPVPPKKQGPKPVGPTVKIATGGQENPGQRIVASDTATPPAVVSMPTPKPLPALSGVAILLDKLLDVDEEASKAARGELEKRTRPWREDPDVIKVLPVFVERFAAGDKPYRDSVAGLLAQFGTRAAALIPAFYDLLSGNREVSRQVEIIEIIGTLGKDRREWVPGMLVLLASGEREVREAASRVLENYHKTWWTLDEASLALPKLISTFQEKKPGVQSAVLDIFLKLGSKAAPATKALTAALRGSPADIQIGAANVLENIGPGAKEAMKELEALSKDEDILVALAAKDALEKIAPGYQR